MFEYRGDPKYLRVGKGLEVGIPTLDKWIERIVPEINTLETLEERVLVIKETIRGLIGGALSDLSERQKAILEKVTLSDGSARSLEEIGDSLHPPIASSGVRKAYFWLVKRIEAIRAGEVVPTPEQIKAEKRRSYDRKHARRRLREQAQKNQQKVPIQEEGEMEKLKKEIVLQIEQILFNDYRGLYDRMSALDSYDKSQEMTDEITAVAGEFLKFCMMTPRQILVEDSQIGEYNNFLIFSVLQKYINQGVIKRLDSKLSAIQGA